MGFDTDWCVDRYKSEFESEEHWKLRKLFIETHKDKFSEEKLVCLSRVFFNIEFLGCRYPEKTMKLVAKLSKGVADDHREKMKGKLKRTFVEASEAAKTTIKKVQDEPTNSFLNAIERCTKGFEYSQFVKAPVDEMLPLNECTKRLNIHDFSGFIIFQRGDSTNQEPCPLTILKQSSENKGQKRKLKFSFPIEKHTEEEKYCEIRLDDELLASGYGSTLKEAKEIAAEEGLNKLRQTCYTIKVKQSFFSDNPSLTKDQPAQKTHMPISDNNIGLKMMQKMGWTGGGLGKQKQGVVAPIEVTQIVKRAGIGCVNHKELQYQFRKVFKDYIASNSDHDLVFAPDFSSEERKTLHQLAHNFRLKTKSFGKGNDRHLVVSKLLTPTDLLEMLLARGGENEKYLLIPPTGMH